MIRTIVLFAALIASSNARASLVTYELTFRTTGSVNGFSFTDAPTTIAMTADTSTAGLYQFTGGPYYQAIQLTSLSFTIQGFRTATFGVSAAFLGIVPQADGRTNFVITERDQSGNPGVGFVTAIFAGAYPDALTTSTGPLAGGTGGFAGGGPALGRTSIGNLIIQSNTPGSATFQSRAVPEPASILMLGLGLAGFGWKRFQRRRR